MATNVTLPALGESVTEGTVTMWLKNVGDTVEVDEPLLEISTDKVDTEIPSPVAGVLLEIKAAEDETVEVGAVLARLVSLAVRPRRHLLRRLRLSQRLNRRLHPNLSLLQHQLLRQHLSLPRLQRLLHLPLAARPLP